MFFTGAETSPVQHLVEHIMAMPMHVRRERSAAATAAQEAQTNTETAGDSGRRATSGSTQAVLESKPKQKAAPASGVRLGPANRSRGAGWREAQFCEDEEHL